MSDAHSLEVVVVGAGGVGLGLGSALLAAGVDVRFVGRPATVKALSRHGLERSGLFGAFACGPERFGAATRLGDLLPPPPDFVLVAVKSFDSEAAANALAAQPALVPETTPILLCQNGWGNAERFTRHFPRTQVYSARVITGFRRPALHRVEITAHAEPIHVGSLFDAPLEPMAPLCTAITAGGIPCEVSSHVDRDLWAKLLYNALLNPMGALFGVPYGALAASPAAREVMTALAEETFAVMRATGHRTHWAGAGDYLDFFYRELIPATAAHESSTLQDLRAGKPTEIDALTGAVVALGDAHDVPVPVSRTLLAQIRFLEERQA